MGLRTHDTIVVMAPNHIHLTVPIYAALYLGVGVAGVDMTLKIAELEGTLNIVLPKLIFCQDEKSDEVQNALRNINHAAQIVTYDDSENFLPLSNLLKMGDMVPVEEFKATDIDSENTIALLIATSGTTGLPKFAAASHKNVLSSVPYPWLPYNKFPTPFKTFLVISPVQWVSAQIVFMMGSILRFTRIQTSLPITPEHFQDLVNKYKPSETAGSPNIFMYSMDKEKCDLSCFERIIVGGSAVPTSLMNYIKEASPHTKVSNAYGNSETTGIVLLNLNSIPGSVGVPLSSYQYRLVDPETQEDIHAPNVPGELWLKGPAVFMGYYKNPKMTEIAKTKDGWFKTGDILYKDEHDNYFFVERLKMLMKYMNHQISPIEIEAVILKHPGVLDVAVTRIPDTKRGDLPVACVVRREGYDVTAQEIKDMVKETLTDTKQLRGGVIFMKQLPMTASMKVNRAELANVVLTMNPE